MCWEESTGRRYAGDAVWTWDGAVVPLVGRRVGMCGVGVFERFEARVCEEELEEGGFAKEDRRFARVDVHVHIHVRVVRM